MSEAPRFVGPAALCRMDDALVSRIARGERLGSVALSAGAVVIVGAAAYGFAFGLWRAPEQAAYSALKLPALLLALVLATTTINAMLALLLRAPLGLRQSAVCILVGQASTAAILGALTPVSIYVAMAMPDPDPTVLGLLLTDPRADAANRAAQSLLLYHVAVIAFAGVLGNLRLFALLRRLSGRRDLALRVLVAWLAVELLAGSELSWIFRPFLARPHRRPELISDVAFEGSFFEEIGEALSHSLGTEGSIALAIVAVTVAVAAFWLARSDGLRVTVTATSGGLDVVADEARFFVAWDSVGGVAARAAPELAEEPHELVIDVAHEQAPRLLARFAEEAERDALAARIEALRSRAPGPGPFRVAASPARRS